jgi:hypothetical protein
MYSPWICAGPIAGILAIDILATEELVPRASGWLGQLGVALVVTALLFATFRVLLEVWEEIQPKHG